MSRAKPKAVRPVEPIVPTLIIKEGALIVLVALAAYLLMALGSYVQSDPGWSSIDRIGQVKNLGGSVGAWLADVLFSLFGFIAYLLPMMLLYRAWLIFRDRHQAIRLDGLLLGLRITGAFLTILGFAGIVSLNSPDSKSLPFSAGGLLGREFSELLLGVLHPNGSALLLVALSLFGLTLLTEVSWLALMDAIGKWTLQLVAQVAGRWQDWRERRAEIARQKPVRPREPIFRPEVTQGSDATPSMLGRIKNSTGIGSTSQPVASKPVGTKIKPTVLPTAKRIPAKRSGSKSHIQGLPSLSLLDEPDHHADVGYSESELESLSRLLEIKLKDFGIVAEVVSVLPGPVVTRFEIQPAAGVKVSRISNLVKDLARSLAVVSVRVVEVIPGKSVVGIEIPNQDREIVMFSDVLSSPAYQNASSPLSLALGHDIAGEPVVADLAKMPHLLVAGTTGSGKSVGVNAMLLSFLFKATPEEVRLILIDPKMLELSVYEGIPHLLTPVITDMKDAANGLRWSVAEMERRYKLMAALGVRNLAGFNKKIKEAIAAGKPIVDPLWVPDNTGLIEDDEASELEPLPMIVVVIDEFADMMMIVGKKVEQLIARIAQKARAAGIHLILATQRPSVDVITGLIKANVPTRVGFQVSSKVDSRTILDQGGAEQLLGHGDMLYMPPGTAVPIRVHGAFVSDEEVHRVADDWRSRGEPDYIEGVVEGDAANEAIPGLAPSEEDNSEVDALYDEAVHFVTETRRASISAVQRKLRIGYNRAARMIEAMEVAGVVSEMLPNGSREVLAAAPPK